MVTRDKILLLFYMVAIQLTLHQIPFHVSTLSPFTVAVTATAASVDDLENNGHKNSTLTDNSFEKRMIVSIEGVVDQVSAEFSPYDATYRQTEWSSVEKKIADGDEESNGSQDSIPIETSRKAYLNHVNLIETNPSMQYDIHPADVLSATSTAIEDGYGKSVSVDALKNPLYMKEIEGRKRHGAPCVDAAPDCLHFVENMNSLDNATSVKKLCNEFAWNGKKVSDICPVSCNVCNPNVVGKRSGLMQRKPPHHDLLMGDLILRQKSKKSNTVVHSEESLDSIFLHTIHETKIERVRATADLSDHFMGHTYSVECTNRNSDCSIWAVEGACEQRPKKMNRMCGAACQTCHLNYYSFSDSSSHSASFANDYSVTTTPYRRLDLMGVFEAIKLGRVGARYDPSVYEYVDQERLAVVPVISFEHFLSPQECQHYIGLIESWTQFSKSDSYEDVGEKTELSTFTSSLCDGVCMKHPLTRSLYRRAAKVTGAPESSIDNISFEKFENKQFQSIHRKWDPFEARSKGGSRIVSIYLFLNSLEDESGGELQFPYLKLSFAPKEGRAIMFPNAKSFHSSEYHPSFSILEQERMTALRQVEVIGDLPKYGVLITFREHSVRGPKLNPAMQYLSELK